MPLTPRRLWTRVRIDGTTTITDANSQVTINESLDSLTRVCEFELAEHASPVPAEGDAVTVDFTDFDEGLYWRYYGGNINALEVESQPWSFVVRCTGQLSKLRRVRTNTDHDFSGDTEGEAWKYVMTFCGITYDNVDVADTGYVLGASVPVLWTVDTPGSQIIQELDKVFGTSTLEIGNNRIIRIPVNLVPDDDTALYKTYTRGLSIDFSGHHRSHGDKDRIQNNWIVTGATIEQDNGCNITPWARAVAANAQIGRRTRVQSQSFQSDLIQDESLAEAIVRRLMRETNRLPEEATAEMVNDPSLYCGIKIAILDVTYGIAATPRYYTITSIDRTGYDMSLTLSGGPPGDEGTVTTGAEKVCNDTQTDTDLPGSFPGFGEFPDDFPIGFPDFDLDLDLDFDFPDFGIPDFGGIPDFSESGDSDADDLADICIFPDSTEWTTITGPVSLSPGIVTFSDTSTSPSVILNHERIPVNPPTRVKISGHWESGGPGTFGEAPIMSVLLKESGVSFAGLQADWYPADEIGFFYAFGFDGGFEQTITSDSAIFSGFDFEIIADPFDDSLILSINGVVISTVALGTGNDCDIEVSAASASVLEFIYSDLQICFGEPDSLVDGLGDWRRYSPSLWGADEIANWHTSGDGITANVVACVLPQTGQGIELYQENETIPADDDFHVVFEGWVDTGGDAQIVCGIYAIDESVQLDFRLSTPDADSIDGQYWPADAAEDFVGSLILGEDNPWRLTVDMSGDQLTYTWESPIGTTVHSNVVPAAGWAGMASGWCGAQMVFFADETDGGGQCSNLNGELTRFEITT